jgi:DNA polymerase-1
MSHLVIIDGHAVAHRAYHSIPPLTTNGQPVNAIYGFYSMLLSAVDTLKPNYLVVCLDSPGPTFRQSEFVGYRAKRKPTDPSLVSQLPLIPQTLDIAKINYFALGGYEADDLISTLTRRSLKKRRRSDKKSIISKVTIITGDKDLMQLVSDQVSLFVPIRGLSETKLFGPAEVKEKLGVDPDQVIDLKALMGDMSDSYPGVAGVGPVAATDLLKNYQTLDNIYSHLEDIKSPLREKLIKDKDNAYLSQKLATLIANIPLKFTLKPAKFGPPNILGLESLFTEYNFKSLLSRLHHRYPSKSALPTKVKVSSNQTSLF